MRRNLVVASSLLVLGCLITSTSCGGTSVTNGDGGGGGGSGGTGHKDGSADTGTGSTDSGGGPDATGGKDATGLHDGPTTGEGGASCPGTAPKAMTPCTEGAGACSYPEDGGTEVCDCFGGGGGTTGGEWNCSTCAACPGIQPTGPCMTGGFACRALPPCTYSGTSCTCAEGATTGTGDWVCGTCPATEPTGMTTTCTTTGLECVYGTETCTCRGGATGGDHWICPPPPPPPCPTMEPTAGSMCTEGQGGFMGCTYGTSKCTCTNAGTMMTPKYEWECT
jgi:hypothetical protein